jgi:hypothetical protein
MSRQIANRYTRIEPPFQSIVNSDFSSRPPGESAELSSDTRFRMYDHSHRTLGSYDIAEVRSKPLDSLPRTKHLTAVGARDHHAVVGEDICV